MTSLSLSQNLVIQASTTLEIGFKLRRKAFQKQQQQLENGMQQPVHVK